MKNETCSKCDASFQCGAENKTVGCWCNSYPHLFDPDPTLSCICETCLHNAIKLKVEEYVSEMTPAKAFKENKASKLPKAKHLLEGIDYYLENSYTVFTSWYHLKRGYCCKNICRHCPYGFKKTTIQT